MALVTVNLVREQSNELSPVYKVKKTNVRLNKK